MTLSILILKAEAATFAHMLDRLNFSRL